MKSQNGWETISSATSPSLMLWYIGPVKLIGRSDAAGFVLGHYLLWFHTQIEPLWPTDMPDHDDHWWSQRYIGNTTVPSNHWSATAVDVNALRHPQGTEPEVTFTEGECKRIRRKIEERYPVLKWGGDFRTLKDSMHTELLPLKEATEADVKALADDLWDTLVGRQLRKAQPKPVSRLAW